MSSFLRIARHPSEIRKILLGSLAKLQLIHTTNSVIIQYNYIISKKLDTLPILLNLIIIFGFGFLHIVTTIKLVQFVLEVWLLWKLKW